MSGSGHLTLMADPLCELIGGASSAFDFTAGFGGFAGSPPSALIEALNSSAREL